MRTRRVGHSPAIRQARKGMEFDREFSFGDGVSSVSTHVAIRTSILPKFLPCSRPRNAAGAFSSPSTMIVQPDHPLAERDLSSAGGAPLPARFPSASARALGSLSLSSSRSSGTAASIPGCRGPRRPRCHAAGYQIDRFRYLLRQTVQQAPPQSAMVSVFEMSRVLFGDSNSTAFRPRAPKHLRRPPGNGDFTSGYINNGSSQHCAVFVLSRVG